MPTVNGKKYPYTKAGMAAAKAAKKTRKGPADVVKAPVRKGVKVGKKVAQGYNKNKKKIDAAGRVAARAFPAAGVAVRAGKKAAKTYLRATDKRGTRGVPRRQGPYDSQIKGAGVSGSKQKRPVAKRAKPKSMAKK
jgi:hypothetical protein